VEDYDVKYYDSSFDDQLTAMVFNNIQNFLVLNAMVMEGAVYEGSVGIAMDDAAGA